MENEKEIPGHLIPGNFSYSFAEALQIEDSTRTPLDTDWKNKTIIPFFGCSFTYGQGLTYNDVFTNMIQNKLQSDHLALNIGSPGGSMDLITRVITQYSNRIELKNSKIMVINIPPINRREHFYSLTANYDNPNWRKESVYESKIETRRLLPSVFNKAMANEDWRSYIHLSNPVTDLSNFERNLVFLSNFSKANNIKVFLWGENAVQSSMVCSTDMQRIRAYIHKLGLKIIDISEVVSPDPKDSLKYVISETDRHYNKLGNQIIADRIYDSIQQYLN